jgi:hypothetical protein
MSLWSIIAETWQNTPAAVQTIITAAFGTFVGAFLTSRSQTKRRVVDELKAVHAARALCFSITNRALALKRQQIIAMRQRYDEAVAAFQAHERGVLELPLDLQTVSQVKFPDAVLERIVFEKCAIGAKALAAVVAVSGAVDDLRNAIDFRNSLISEFRERRSEMTELERIQLYVGATRAGEVDKRFATNIQALSQYTDDCIFFSVLLSKELMQYGNSLHFRNRFKFRLGVPKLLPVDWTIAEEARLIPDDAEFANWTAGFRRPPTTWERFGAWIKGFANREASPVDERAVERGKPKPFRTLGRTGYRKRSKGPHSTFVDHKK